MNTIVRTEAFDVWLSKLKDARGKARIIERIRSAERGNFGDCDSIGHGVSECVFTLVRAIGCISLALEM
jgi:putative addiction module killer protein